MFFVKLNRFSLFLQFVSVKGVVDDFLQRDVEDIIKLIGEKRQAAPPANSKRICTKYGELLWSSRAASRTGGKPEVFRQQ